MPFGPCAAEVSLTCHVTFPLYESNVGSCLSSVVDGLPEGGRARVVRMAKNVACGAPRLCFSSDKQGRVFWSFRSTDVAGGSPASSETAVNLTQFLVLGNQRGMRIESALVERKVRVSICFRLQKKRLRCLFSVRLKERSTAFGRVLSGSWLTFAHSGGSSFFHIGYCNSPLFHHAFWSYIWRSCTQRVESRGPTTYPFTSSVFRGRHPTRIWASLRAQTPYRSVSGMMNYSKAIKLLYRAETREVVQ